MRPHRTDKSRPRLLAVTSIVTFSETAELCGTAVLGSGPDSTLGQLIQIGKRVYLVGFLLRLFFLLLAFFLQFAVACDLRDHLLHLARHFVLELRHLVFLQSDPCSIAGSRRQQPTVERNAGFQFDGQKPEPPAFGIWLSKARTSWSPISRRSKPGCHPESAPQFEGMGSAAGQPTIQSSSNSSEPASSSARVR